MGLYSMYLRPDGSTNASLLESLGPLACHLDQLDHLESRGVVVAVVADSRWSRWTLPFVRLRRRGAS